MKVRDGRGARAALADWRAAVRALRLERGAALGALAPLLAKPPTVRSGICVTEEWC